MNDRYVIKEVGLSLEKNIFESVREKSKFVADKENLQKLLQMALEVELFTIPLYMSSMYSIYGYHQINTGNNFYQGRQWPGLSPKFSREIASDPKQNAFNKIFKVFIEEMLHLQIAANLCNAYDQKPKFHDNSLVNADYSWKCYGNENTVIPGVIDFKDLKPDLDFSKIIVNLNTLNKEQIKLFIAIESSENNLKNQIKESEKEKYHHCIPFNELDQSKLDSKKILFGSISGLYTAIILYLLIRYDDGERLFQKAFSENEKVIQRDHFNKSKDSDRKSEYPHFRTNLTGITKSTVKFSDILGMINGILDQGEGLPLEDLIVLIISKILVQVDTIKLLLESLNVNQKQNIIKKIVDGTYLSHGISKATLVIIKKYLSRVFQGVAEENRVSDEALANNHPSYDDKGEKIESASQAARGGENGKKEHLEIFREVEALIDHTDFQTWDQYHKDKEDIWEDKKDIWEDKKDIWEATHLIANNEDYQTNLKNYPQLVSAKEIAKAMNEVTNNKENETWITLLSQANTGTLKGLLNGMEGYWNDENKEFPSPAMSGSADRMSICWALLGCSPNLSIPPLEKNREHKRDYHACQGLYLPKYQESELDGKPESQDLQYKCGSPKPETYNDWVRNGELGCASPAVYHSCKGANTCKSEGGCGFVQVYEGGGSCGSSPSNNPYSVPIYVSAPGANNCGGKGGCAVPISALQMFPAVYEGDQMMKYKHNNDVSSEVNVNFYRGELVYDVAWKVYTQRYKQRFGRIPKKPKANILRLIFPPST